MSAICAIKVAGQTVGLRFGLPAAIRIFSSDLSNMFQGDSYSVQGAAKVLYEGYRNACMAKDIIAELQFEDFYEHMEEQSMAGELNEDIVNAFKVFQDSKATEKAVEKMKEIVEEKKSQLIGSGSSPSQEVNSD